MSKPITYVTRKGDTFDSVARSATGADTNADAIRSSNPGASEPFEAGVVLDVPSTTAEVAKVYRASGLDLRVDGKNIDTISDFTITIAIDGFRRCEFTTANEIETRAILPAIKPASVDLGYNGTALMTGHLEAPQADSSDDRKALVCSVASSPEVMTSPPSASAYPLAFEDVDLQNIAQKICGLYSLSSVFDVPPGPVFKDVKIKQTQNAVYFLGNLAKQRSMIFSDDAFGSVVFSDGAALGAPVLIADDEQRPDVNVSTTRNAANYYSHITGILKGKRGRERSRYTVNNKFYNGIIRQHTFEVSDIDKGELETSVNSVAARMFGDVFSATITVPGWTDRNGDVFAPGSLVKIRSPRNYIDDFYELLIRTVTLRGQPDQKTATLTCVIPGVFAGKIPEYLPWK